MQIPALARIIKQSMTVTKVDFSRNTEHKSLKMQNDCLKTHTPFRLRIQRLETLLDAPRTCCTLHSELRVHLSGRCTKTSIPAAVPCPTPSLAVYSFRQMAAIT